MNLPSGLASISSQFDDAPQVKGAVAFGRMVRREEEQRKNEMFRAVMDSVSASVGAGIIPWDVQALAWNGTGYDPVRVCWYHGVPCFEFGENDPLTSAIDRHAALVIGSAYRSADRR